MGINVPRLVLGGLVAGFIINLGELAVNVWLLGDAWTAALAPLGISVDAPAMAIWGLASFILGTVGVWIYAAIRPCYPSGTPSALRAGGALWAATYLYAAVGAAGTLDLPAALVLGSLLWGFVEMLVAVYVGAWLYRSGELAAT